ncbi:hypothetical protein J7I98_11730 [Streptomyces sp. ISL-98]|uniref:hypothetical protein n=1 Tax=Streptomyces sp. ISL-98 TaxID=2819192 RepID=UPI001BE6912D|nr:hypothetical protein [Streptomyces sp. ISL-98]MBT2506554.1 hypothetical protein [Streptomyces sp. ISL-98]
MGDAITMPLEDELPAGPVRDFVEELHVLYEAAGSPPLRATAADIKADQSLRGTASREAVRGMLHGRRVPRRWSTVEALLIILCKEAKIEVTAFQHSGHTWEQSTRATPGSRALGPHLGAEHSVRLACGACAQARLEGAEVRVHRRR